MKRLLLILCLALVGSACTSRKPDATRPTPSPTGGPSISVVFGVGSYSHNGFFKASLKTLEPARLPASDTGPFKSYSVKGSPDGRLIAGYTYVQGDAIPSLAELEVSSAATPGAERTIATHKHMQIVQVMWSDPTTLFYTTIAEKTRDSKIDVRTIKADGSGERLITTLDQVIGDVRFRQPSKGIEYRLEAADMRKGVVYLSKRRESTIEVVRIALTDGEQSALPGKKVTSESFAFSPGGSTVYYCTKTELIARKLSDGKERTVFRFSSKATRYAQEVSPRGDALTVREAVGRRWPDYVLTLKDGRYSPLVFHSKAGTFSRWSPDGIHLWFECSCGPAARERPVLMDVAAGTSRMISYAFTDKDDHPIFQTWLVTS